MEKIKVGDKVQKTDRGIMRTNPTIGDDIEFVRGQVFDVADTWTTHLGTTLLVRIKQVLSDGYNDYILLPGEWELV